MSSSKMSVFGGLLAVAAIAGWAAPVSADTFVSYSSSGGDFTYVSSSWPSVTYYASSGPSYSSYSSVSYRSTTTVSPYYNVSYTSYSPSYYRSSYVRSVSTGFPSDVYYSSRTTYVSW